MAGGTLQQIFSMPPGGVVRSSSGFFCRLANGAIAFVPSVFRLPWHADAARIVGAPEIVKLLRAETAELAIGVMLLLAGIHYFFFDILNFYMAALSLPLAILAHIITTAAGVVLVLAVNNSGFACLRIGMVARLAKAPDGSAADAIAGWRTKQRLWKLSFLSADTAASLNKAAVVLYILMFLAAGPLLVIVLVLLVLSGKSSALDGAAGSIFALYIGVSIWALVESSMVLHQRMRAGRSRRRGRRLAA
jgi:hypothetical protein